MSRRLRWFIITTMACLPSLPARAQLLPEWSAPYGAPLEFRGYSEGYWIEHFAEELAAMRADGCNAWVTNIFWVADRLRVTDGDPGWRLTTPEEDPRFAIFERALEITRENGWHLNAGALTCTNFHMLPVEFVERYPDTLARGPDGRPVPLQLEGDVRPGMSGYWPGFEGLELNRVREAFVRDMLGRYGRDPRIAAWSIDGESLHPPNMGERRYADYSPPALAHFRDWLKLQYGGELARLNRLWGAAFASWDDVEPPRAPLWDRPSLDWHRFRIAVIGEYNQWLYAMYRELAPDTPAFCWLHDVGFRGFQAGECGIVPHQVARSCDGVNADPIVRPPDYLYNVLYFDVMASFGKPIMAREYSYYPRPIPPEDVVRMSLECLGQGMWAQMWVHWGGTHGEIDWGIAATPARHEIARFFTWVRSLEDDLRGMQPAEPDVRVYLGEPMWILRGFSDHWRAVHTSLVARQIPRRFLFDPQIGDTRLWPRALIVPDANVVTRPVLAAIREYLLGGGTVVLYGTEETYAEDLPCVGPSTLDDVLDPGEAYGRIARRYEAEGGGALLHFDRQYPATDCVRQRNVDLVTDTFLRERGIEPRLAIQTDPPDHIALLESFHLTDGANDCYVLVNTAGLPVEVRVDQLIAGRPARFAPCGEAWREHGNGRVTLPAGGGGVLRVEGTAEVRPEYFEAVRYRVDTLRREGYDTEVVQRWLDEARAADVTPARARALLARLRDAVVFRAEPRDSLVSVAEARIDASRPVPESSPTAWLRPLFEHRLPVRRAGGRHVIGLQPETWPQVRDFAQGRYTRYEGRLELIVSRAEDGARGFTRIRLHD